jgi:hypothetical protein
MEKTLLALAMPIALQQLRKMLIGKGFLVQTMPTSNPVLIAFRKGSIFRKKQHLILEIIGEANNKTRVEITAIADKANNRLEKLIEGKIVTAITHAFKKVTGYAH